MHFMLLLLIISSINAVMPIVVSKSEVVKAILYEYNHSAILRLKQQFILHGNVTVQIEPLMNEINFVNIECRKKGDEEFHMFDTLDLKNCKARERFYCVQDKKTYLIYFNITINIEFSQSEWRMNGYYNGYEFSSNAVTIPIVQPNVEASLFKFNQSYSKCEQDILENEEIVLEGHVRFYGDFEEDEKYIEIEQKLTTSINYNSYSIVFLNQCETSSNFKCIKDGDLNSYRITLALNATKNLSESHWRLTGKFKETHFFSFPVELPRILDLSQIVMRLNGQTLTQTNTSLTIKEDEELTLCCDVSPIPCLAVITVNHIHSISNLSCVSHRPSKSHKSTYTFGYILCGDTKYSHEFPVEVDIDAVKDTTEGVSLGTILGAVLGTIIVLIALIFLFYFYYYRKEKNQVQNFTVEKPLLSPSQANTSPEERSSFKVEIPESMTASDSENKGKDNSPPTHNSINFRQRYIPESEIKMKVSAATPKDVKKNQ